MTPQHKEQLEAAMKVFDEFLTSLKLSAYIKGDEPLKLTIEVDNWTADWEPENGTG